MLHGALRGPYARSRLKATFAAAPTQTETTSWQAAVIANSGTVSAGRLAIVNEFIAAEKSNGAWALTDDYWPLWAENVPQALTSLKQRRLAVSVSGPNFVGDRGYLFDGTVNYLNTGFIAGTHALSMDGNNMRIAAYVRNETTAANYSVGIQNTATQNLALVVRNGLGVPFALNGGGSMTLVVATSMGYTATSRAGGGLVCNGYKNGSLFSTVSVASVGTVLPSLALFIGCRNNAGSPLFFRPDFTGFVTVGAPLSAAQELGQYTNVQAWAAAVGAQV